MALYNNLKQILHENPNWRDLCDLDDFVKLLTVDEWGVSTKKYQHRHIPFIEDVKSKLNLIYERFLNKGNVDEVVESLVKVSKSFELFTYFKIQNKCWLNLYLRSYLNLLHQSSKVKLVECQRYSLDDHKGITVVATQDIEVQTRLYCLFGLYMPLTAKDEVDLAKEKKDFSIISVTGSRKPNILIGNLAFLNHDCDYNCTYVKVASNIVTVKVIKKIKKNEEIYVNYGDHYFDENNKECECNTCQQKRNDSSNDEDDFQGFTKSLNEKEFGDCISCKHDDQRSDSLHRDDDITNFPDVSLDERLSSSFVRLERLVDTVMDEPLTDSSNSLASDAKIINDDDSSLQSTLNTPPPLLPPRQKVTPQGHQQQSNHRQGSAGKPWPMAALTLSSETLISRDLVVQPASNLSQTSMNSRTTSLKIQHCSTPQVFEENLESFDKETHGRYSQITKTLFTSNVSQEDNNMELLDKFAENILKKESAFNENTFDEKAYKNDVYENLLKENQENDPYGNNSKNNALEILNVDSLDTDDINHELQPTKKRVRKLRKENDSIQSIDMNSSNEKNKSEAKIPKKSKKRPTKSKKRLNKSKKLKRKVYCMYCKKDFHQFARHLKQHKEEKFVEMYLKEDDETEKNRILGYIRNKGYGLLEKETGKQTPVKSTRKNVITTKIKCNMCDGRFSKETLNRHKKNCFGNDVARMNENSE